MSDADGIIQVIKEEAGAVAIVNSNVGTVNYETGKMTLVGFQPYEVEQVVNTNTIEIYVETNVQDVTPIREQVILINKKDVVVNMILDTAAQTGDFVQATANETPSLVVYGANTA